MVSMSRVAVCSLLLALADAMLRPISIMRSCGVHRHLKGTSICLKRVNSNMLRPIAQEKRLMHYNLGPQPENSKPKSQPEKAPEAEPEVSEAPSKAAAGTYHP